MTRINESTIFGADLYPDAALYVTFRQQMRSSYVAAAATSNQTAAGHDIQFEEVSPTTLTGTNYSVSMENSSTITASETEAMEVSHPYPHSASLSKAQIEKKARKQALLMEIVYKVNEVNKLLDDYINLK